MSWIGYLAAAECGLLVAAMLLLLMPHEMWRGRG